MKTIKITRRGYFITKNTQESNKCANQNQTTYKYIINIAFDSPKLDDNGFIIDHNVIDDYIQGLVLKGSCEQMSDKIISKLKQELTRKYRVVGIGLSLFTSKNTLAYITETWVTNLLYLSTITTGLESNNL